MSRSFPFTHFGFISFKRSKYYQKKERNSRRSSLPLTCISKLFKGFGILKQPEISFLFLNWSFCNFKTWFCQGFFFFLFFLPGNHSFKRCCFLNASPHPVEVDYSLTTLFQPNLLTSSTLYPDSFRPDHSGRRHWLFRGWPHPYRDRLLLWGDGTAARRWGGRARRNPRAGKKKTTHSRSDWAEDVVRD